MFPARIACIISIAVSRYLLEGIAVIQYNTSINVIRNIYE
jgi:hypothetical protein